MLDFIFNAKSIAVIGASNRPGKIGFEIFRNIVEGGFQGKIYPINPKITELIGHTCYHTIKDVPDTVDLAVIVIPAPIIPEVLEQCGEKGVKGVIIISAGFSEVGNVELENKIVNIAKKYGIRIVGPNCAGIVNTHQNLFPTIEVRPPKGFIAFVSQSGALGGAILMKAKEEQFGISIFASYGNACDVNESDILEYLMEDENSKVVVIYIEAVKNGRRFIETSRKLSLKKPLIGIKAGKTEAGTRAVASHTGSLAGQEKIYEAAFKQAGIISVEDFDEMFDLSKVLLHQPPAKGDKIAIITNSGGPAVMLTDACETFGLKIPPTPEETKKKLSFLPSVCSLENPIDLVADASYERYRKTLETLVVENWVDGIIVVHVPPVWIDAREPAKAVVDVYKQGVNKPIIVCWMAGEPVKEAIKILEENNIPNFPTPRKAAKAMWALVERGKILKRLKEQQL